MTRRLSSFLLVAALGAAIACSDDPEETDGDTSSDEGEEDSAGEEDDDESDARVMDGGRNDAGRADAGRDSGSGTMDSGRAADSGRADSGRSDGGSSGGDAGRSDSGTRDSGMMTGGGDDLCSAEPADECESCGCTECEAEFAACVGLEGTASAGPGAGQSKSDLCQAVVLCGQMNGCRSDVCFLGTTADGAADTAAILMPHGACVDEILAAAEAASPLDVVTRRADMNFALFYASAISDCSVASCAEACGM